MTRDKSRVTSIRPEAIMQGRAVDLELLGEGLSEVKVLAFSGEGVKVDNVASSANAVRARVGVDRDAEYAWPRDIQLETARGPIDTSAVHLLIRARPVVRAVFPRKVYRDTKLPLIISLEGQGLEGAVEVSFSGAGLEGKVTFSHDISVSIRIHVADDADLSDRTIILTTPSGPAEVDPGVFVRVARTSLP